MERVFAIRAFSDNYIWVIPSADGQRALVVDPGDARPVSKGLAERGLELAGILVTHHHADHTGGIERLLREHNVPVYGPAGERIIGVTRVFSDGNRVTPDGFDLTFEVIDCPGHTAGHIAFYGHGMLFCGDTLFAGGCGRLFEGTAEQMYASLQRFTKLPADTRVYCAHEYTQANLTFAARVEPDNNQLLERLEIIRRARATEQNTLPSTIGEELATNPFLRSDSATVRQQATAHAGHSLERAVDVFATIRAWKDAS